MSIIKKIKNLLTFGAYSRIETLEAQIAALEDYIVEREVE